MTKRNGNIDNPFAQHADEPDTKGYEHLAESFMGSFDVKKTERIKTVNIFEIYPDPAQPRRVMPSAVRAKWDGQPNTLPELFNVWVELVKAERADFDPLAYFSDEQFERPEEIGGIEKPFVDLIDLAVSIQRDGLTNPITAIDFAGKYRIETGERRWLAFHLLHLISQDKKWLEIPVRVVNRADVWRQATENATRAELNAIGRARQLAVLLMDIYARQEKEFKTFSEMVKPGGCDREFYAQVADGDEFRVPKGMGEKIIGAMGLSHVTQIRQYRALLRISDQAWMRADDENWSENYIREASEQHTVTGVTVSGKKSPSTNQVKLVDERLATVIKRIFGVTEADIKDQSAKDRVIDHIRRAREALDVIEKRLRG